MPAGIVRAVEIGAETDAVLADALDQVLEVVDHEIDGRVRIVAAVRAQEAGCEVDADHAAGLRGSRPAACRSDCANAGQSACALEWVATSGALLIAATSQKPRSLRCDRSIRICKRLQAPISSLPSVGEARSGIGRRRTKERHAMPERIRPAPDRTERAKSGCIQHVEQLEVRVDRLRALDMKDRRQHAVGEACSMSSTLRQMRTRPCDSRSMRSRSDSMLKTARLRRASARRPAATEASLRRRRKVRLAIARSPDARRGNEDREQASREAALPRHRKIELALGLPVEERTGGFRAAAPMEPQQNVVVAVEDRHTAGRRQGISAIRALSVVTENLAPDERNPDRGRSAGRPRSRRWVARERADRIHNAGWPGYCRPWRVGIPVPPRVTGSVG